MRKALVILIITAIFFLSNVNSQAANCNSIRIAQRTCSNELAPVCAQLMCGNERCQYTARNKCIACMDNRVTGYITGSYITEIHQICTNQVRKVNTETINSPIIKNIVKSFNKNSSCTNNSLQGRIRLSIKEKNINNSNVINSFSKKLKILQQNSSQSIGKDSINEFKKNKNNTQTLSKQHLNSLGIVKIDNLRKQSIL